MLLKKKVLASKLQLRGRPQKNPTPVQLTSQELIAIKTTQSMEPTREKNEYKTVISISELSSKIYKLKSYNETVHNLIYGCQWGEVIENELQDIENHQM